MNSDGMEPAAPVGRAADYMALTKPGITRLVLVTTAAGFWLASRGRVDAWLLLHALVGTGLVASGTNALNQYFERDADALMRRTRGRPLPAGRLRPERALAFASAISVLGLAYLAALVNVATSAVVAAALLSYVFVYTPLKRRTTLATVVGAVPGALPVVAGWTAAGGRLGVEVGALFGILFLWQLPHFLSLAWLYREDYRAGGFAMLSVFDPDGARTARQVLVWGLALIPVTLVPTLLGLTGAVYFFGALALGSLFLALGAALLLARSENRARRLFLGSVLYLPLLLLLMAVDTLPG